MEFSKFYFPYNSIREGQDYFLEKVYDTISNNNNLVVSAPTGLGKTISALGPALKIAKEKELTIVYLTSRQTQIDQVVKTLKEINSVYGLEINAVSFVGKKNMCLHKDKEEYYGKEFNDFCKKMREYGSCKYFKNMKKEDNESNINKVIEDSSKNFYSIEEFVGSCKFFDLCPYEVASQKVFKSDVVICDYNYFFSSNIREMFMGKVGRTEEEIILICDEAHNLPDRIRGMYSTAMNVEAINRALKESRDFFKGTEYDEYLREIKNIIENFYIEKLQKVEESLVYKKEFTDEIDNRIMNHKLLLEKLRDAERVVKEDRIVSFIGRIANFLESWISIEEESFIRTVDYVKTEKGVLVSLKLLNIDPSEISGEILNNVYSSILMSATLSPLEMYRDVLGVRNSELVELDSPFPKENFKLQVMDDLTTKYTFRGEKMFRSYGEYIMKFLQKFNRNTIVFFPSYDLMAKILTFVNYNELDKRVMKERGGMSKEEKEEIIRYFRNPMKKNVLFAVVGGSFSEGVDLPEEALEMILVAGLPLPKPNLVIEKIIELYDRKFDKGKDYGYVFPSISKIVQSGGRCIRTENDKGLVVLMDNRFKWKYYSKSFPKHWKFEKFLGFEEIEDFFKE